MLAGDGENAGSSVLAGREAVLCVVSLYTPLLTMVEKCNRLADLALEHFTSMISNNTLVCVRM